MKGSTDICSLIEVLSSGDVSKIVDGDALHFQQLSLHGEPPLIPTQLSVSTYRPVTRDDDGEWVPRQSHPNRSSTGGSAQISSNPLIGDYGPARYSMLGPQHILLERRAEIQSGLFKRKANVFSVQESSYLVSEPVDFDARRWFYAWEGFPDRLWRW